MLSAEEMIGEPDWLMVIIDIYCPQGCTVCRTHLWCITVYFCSGPRPNVKEHAFKDLLGDQGFVSGKDKAPRTLKEMKHEVDIEGALDPVTAQVTVCVCVCSGNCVCVCVLVTVCVCVLVTVCVQLLMAIMVRVRMSY